jgi:hypothetical protein
MVIPLTHVALILREKNKRKTMMNNIKNTMCRLSDLTQEQIDSLQREMPFGAFDFRDSERCIGISKAGCCGTWTGAYFPTIVTYAEMMQLLGKDMNKQTAQEQIAVMQIEMDKLKAIIDKPEVKTGRVMSVCDWISVDERLPLVEDGMTAIYAEIDVITWDGADVIFNCFQAGRTMAFWSIFVDNRDSVTHWMPLPPPPVELK